MIALVTVGEEVDYLRNLLAEIFLWQKPITAVLIRYDSTTTIVKVYGRLCNDKRQMCRMHNTEGISFFRSCKSGL